ncbi:unnamed protein product [Oikopleura dioica]|uniref:J domain-containing protein n=1 Tax=Oikopleura dioica TaxID=34765 RepID=E4XYB4_OIKDI|nr:unnamed protein product [Oikopleura dioica]
MERRTGCDFYEILGIPRTATIPQIDAAYNRAKSRNLLNDSQKDDVCAAYLILRDNELRIIYDADGDEGIKQQEPMSWMGICSRQVRGLADGFYMASKLQERSPLLPITGVNFNLRRSDL